MSAIIGLTRKLLYLAKINPKFIVDCIKSETINCDDNTYENAMEYLQSISPNPNSSCIAKNHIDSLVDVHIIVPAYNTEKFIKKCIDSIVIPQKNISYQLTIINDGSTDSTATILEEYNKIPEVEVITQNNQGHSGARNAGLKKIKGKYICFVDSDDFISWDALEKMYSVGKESDADIVISNVYRVDTKGKITGTLRMNEKNYNGYPCSKLFKAECFEEICFPEKFWFEDSIVKQIIAARVKNVVAVEDFMYYYTQNPNGITSVSREKLKSIDSLYITLALHTDREKLGIPISQEYYEYILLMSYLSYIRVSDLEDKIAKSVFLIYCRFVKQTFGSVFSSNVKKYKPLEKYLTTCDFEKFKLYCKLLKL